jgi:hypothetical protein
MGAEDGGHNSNGSRNKWVQQNEDVGSSQWETNISPEYAASIFVAADQYTLGTQRSSMQPS